MIGVEGYMKPDCRDGPLSPLLLGRPLKTGATNPSKQPNPYGSSPGSAGEAANLRTPAVCFSVRYSAREPVRVRSCGLIFTVAIRPL